MIETIYEAGHAKIESFSRAVMSAGSFNRGMKFPKRQRTMCTRVYFYEF